MFLVFRLSVVLHSGHFIECVQQSHEVYKADPCIASGARIKVDLLSPDDAWRLLFLARASVRDTDLA